MGPYSELAGMVSVALLPLWPPSLRAPCHLNLFVHDLIRLILREITDICRTTKVPVVQETLGEFLTAGHKCLHEIVSITGPPAAILSPIASYYDGHASFLMVYCSNGR